MIGHNYFDRIYRRGRSYVQEVYDSLRACWISSNNKWPCLSKKYLIVCSESSGSTAIANLLFLEIPFVRFLEEGDHQWVWEAYQNIYKKINRITDYPRLQLFDAIKVPGFANIIDDFRGGFPNAVVIYIVRDPRDFVNSAINTWKVNSVSELSGVSWCSENWLDIPNSDPVERLAIRWKKYINAAMKADNVIFIKYEDFCKDKVGIIKSLADQAGLPFNRDRVQQLCDVQLSHKSVRDYKPKGPGGWKSGLLRKDHIQKIEAICKDEMIAWEYPLETI